MRSLIFLLGLLAAGVGLWFASTREERPPAESVAPPFPGGELVDLSHSYDEQTIFWPTAEGFRLHKDSEGVTPAGYYYSANSFSTSAASALNGRFPT